MNIVRTIGQAFEVCHKMNSDKSVEERDIESKDKETEIVPKAAEEGIDFILILSNY